MTLPVLPGIGDELAQRLPQLGEAVKTLFNPNFKLQQELRRGLASNPGMVQQLADLEAQTPGLLQMLGFGDLGKEIARIPQSITSQNTQLINQGVNQQLQNPQTRDAIVANQSGLLDAQNKQSEIETRKGNLEINKGQLEIQKQDQANRNAEAEAIKNARQIFQQRAGEYGGIRGIAIGIRNGKLSPEDVNALASLPVWRSIEQLMDEDAQRSRIELEASLRSGQATNDAMQRLQLEKAYDAWKSSGFVGNMQGHLLLQSNPQAANLADELIKNPANLFQLPPDQQETARGLVESKIGLGLAREKANQQNYEDARKAFNQAVVTFKNSKGAAKPAAIAVINEALKGISQSTGQPVPEVFWDTTLIDEAKFRIRNPKTGKVEEKGIDELTKFLPPAPSGTQKQLEQWNTTITAVPQAVEELKKAKDKEAEIQQMRADGLPDNLIQVIKQMAGVP